MKSRIILLVATAVALVHLVLYFVVWNGDGDTPPETETEAQAQAEEDAPVPREFSAIAPVAETAGPEITETPSKAEDSRKEPTAETAKPSIHPDAPIFENPETESTIDPMTVGLVDGKTQLPPELAELAQEGVKAVTEERWDDARRHYLELVSAAPDNALAYANLGVAEYQLGNHLAAAGNLEKSLDLNPGIAENWLTLGLIHYERRSLELSLSALTRAIHEDPSSAKARLYLAAVARDYGWREAAVTELERALDIDPNLPEAHFNLALTYLDEKPPRLELARRHYHAAIENGAPPAPDIEALLSPDSPSTGQ